MKKIKTKSKSSRLKFSTLWAKASKAFRQKEGNGKCAVCGSDNVQVHHILSKRFYRQFAFDETNLISLCPKHHTFGKHSAHKNGIWFSEWLKENEPKKYEKALERSCK